MTIFELIIRIEADDRKDAIEIINRSEFAGIDFESIEEIEEE